MELDLIYGNEGYSALYQRKPKFSSSDLNSDNFIRSEFSHQEILHIATIPSR